MTADVDIDVADRSRVLGLIKHVAAKLPNDRRHNSGIYVTEIPRDPVHDMAAIDYEQAEQRGYFKIDLLNMSVYQNIRGHEHYKQLLRTEPPWTRLWQDPDWAKTLVHVGEYTQLLSSMRPDSITKMAAFISVIRPGKSHLQNRSWPEVFAEVWDGDNSRGYTFKKSHAVSYAVLVALHMNMLNQS